MPCPTFPRSDDSRERRGSGGDAVASPRRFVGINVPLGFIPANFFPEQSGPNYGLSPYLKLFEPLRKDFTLLSGVSHPGVDGGHSAAKSFLTGTPIPARVRFRTASPSINSWPSGSAARPGLPRLRWAIYPCRAARTGWRLPSERIPSNSFSRLFLTGSDKEIAAQKRELEDGHSIMDTVLDDAKAMETRISAGRQAQARSVLYGSPSNRAAAREDAVLEQHP